MDTGPAAWLGRRAECNRCDDLLLGRLLRSLRRCQCHVCAPCFFASFVAISLDRAAAVHGLKNGCGCRCCASDGCVDGIPVECRLTCAQVFIPFFQDCEAILMELMDNDVSSFRALDAQCSSGSKDEVDLSALHCLSLTFRYLSFVIHCLVLPFLGILLTFYCLSLTFLCILGVVGSRRPAERWLHLRESRERRHPRWRPAHHLDKPTWPAAAAQRRPSPSADSGLEFP